jgi:tetratricopeptide (TPR) repeat protein
VLPIRHSAAVSVCLLLASCSGYNSATRYVTKGNQFLNQGKLDDSLINFRKALQKNPQSGDAYYGLGRAQILQNQPADAIQSLIQAHRLLKGREDVVVTLADLCIELSARAPGSNKQLYNQLRSLQQDSDANPKLPYQSARLEGYLALADRAPQRAIEAFRRADQILPDQPEILFALSQALLQNEQGKEAEALLQKLLAKHPDFSAGYDGLYAYYLSQSRLEDSEQTLKKKVARFPQSSDFLLQLSAHYWRFNNRKAAEAILEQMLSSRSVFPKAPLLVGRFYGDHLDWEDAIRVLREGEPSSPKERIEYQRPIAEAMIAQRRYEDAKAELDQILALIPADYEVRLKRADVLLESGNPAYLQLAISEYQALAAEKPFNPSLRNALGIAYLRQQNLDAAVTNFKIAVQQHAPYVPPRISLAEISLSRRQYQEALQYADEALGYDPRSLRSQQLRAVALLGLRRFDDARKQIHGLLKERPNDTEARLDLAILDLAEKRFSLAESELRQVYRPGQADLRPMVALVDLLLTLRQQNAAQQTIGRELLASGNPLAVRKTWADALHRHGLLDSAIREYGELASSTNEAEPLLQLAEIYDRMGRRSDAINAAQSAATRRPGDPMTLLYTGYMLEKAGRLQDAERAYRQGLRIKATDAVLMNNLASVLAAQGRDLEEAKKLIEDALKQNPDAPDFRDTLASVYAQKHMYDSSLQVLYGLVKKYPQEMSFRVHLASTLLDKGDRAGAQSELAKLRKDITVPKELEAAVNLLATRLGQQ